jgi:hypothetical protein
MASEQEIDAALLAFSNRASRGLEAIALELADEFGSIGVTPKFALAELCFQANRMWLDEAAKDKAEHAGEVRS